MPDEVKKGDKKRWKVMQGGGADDSDGDDEYDKDGGQ